MNEEMKNSIKGLVGSLYNADYFTGGLKGKKQEYYDTLKACMIMTFILLVICITVILLDYFVF